MSLISDSCEAAVTSIDSDLYILFELSLVLNSFKDLLIHFTCILHSVFSICHCWSIAGFSDGVQCADDARASLEAYMEVNRTSSQTSLASKASQESTVSTKSTGGGGTRGKRRSLGQGKGQERKGRKRKSLTGCVNVDCDGESQASVDKENTPESTQVSVTSMEDSCGTKFSGK